jgi:hypothetical protein
VNKFCRRGHNVFLTGRNTGGDCLKCSRFRSRKYRYQHPDYLHRYYQEQPERGIFYAMKRRCQNSKDSSYKNYGGRGIKMLICSYAEFIKEVGRRPGKNWSIDRIDNDGNYEIGNIRWATIHEQRRNRRDHATTV